MKNYLLIFCFCNIMFAQMKEIKTVPSPTVANLGEYGKSPVSYFTGTPLINIPIYKIELDDLEIPITLDYNAKGVKPDEHPGWVGLNWNLLVGGTVIRTVKDIPDEDLYTYHWRNNQTNTIWGAGYLYNHGVSNTDLWESQEYVKSLASDYNQYLKDTEPDEFYFNVGNISGSFYLNHLGNWVIKSDYNLKVEHDGLIDVPPSETSKDNNITFKGFTITDDKGFKYFFGGELSNIDLSINLYNQAYEHYVANTWHIYKIIGPSGKEIEFEYEKDNAILTIHRSIGYQYKEESKVGYFYCESRPNYYPINACSIRHIVLRPSYLKKIKTHREIIDFKRSNSEEIRYMIFNNGDYLVSYYGIDPDKVFSINESFERAMIKAIFPLQESSVTGQQLINGIQWKKLDTISISSVVSPNIPIISFEFLYNNNSSERLMLKEFLKKGVGSNNIQKYTFEYYDSPSIQLPDYASVQVDHWGYFNAKNDNVDLLKSDLNSIIPSTFYENYYSDRNPTTSINVLTEGSLKKIIYPTGGYTEYVYEPHDCSKEVNSSGILIDVLNKNLGGLRIKKILDFDGFSVNEREFFYKSDYKNLNSPSSGILSKSSQYYFKYEGLISGIRYKQIYFSSQGLLPFSGIDISNHVTYTTVLERTNGNGYSVYNYSNYDNGFLDENIFKYSDIPDRAYTPYTPVNSKSYERGKLLRKMSFNQNDKILLKEEYLYQSNGADFVRGIDPSSIPSCDGYSGYATCFSYKKYTNKYNLVQEKTSLFDYNSDDYIDNSITYEYNTDNLLVKTNSKKSNNGSYSTIYLYPSNLRHANQPYQYMPAYAFIAYMSDMEGIPLVKNSYINDKFINREQILYKIFGERIYPYKSLFYKENKNITFNNVSLPDVSFGEEKGFTYHDYYSNGNVKEYSKENGIKTVILWGYNNTLPVAKIENSDFATVASLLASKGIGTESINESQDHQTKLNSLRSDLPNAMITTYTHKPLVGVSTITDPRGITVYYDYDEQNRLKSVRDHEGNLVNENEYNYKN